MTGYEIGSLILTGIGIVATFSAVFVALFQSKLQVKKNIQVAYNNNVGFVKGACHPECVEFLIFNAGNIKASIYNLYLGKKCNFALVGNRTSPLFLKPKTLDLGQTLSVEVTFKELIFAIKSVVQDSKKLLNQKIVFVIEEISGRKIYYKLKHTYNDYIKWNEGKINLLSIAS